MKNLLIIFILFTSCSAIKRSPEVENLAELASVVTMDAKIDLSQHYNAELHSLNLSDLPMGDMGLASQFNEIEAFIEQNKIQTLLLENIGLTQIPYAIVTYSLLNQTLQYVSLQHNHFPVPTLPPEYVKEIGFLVEDSVSHSEDMATIGISFLG